MAGTIAASLSVRVSNGSFLDTINPTPASVPQSNIGVGGYVQSIPTSDTVIAGISGLTTNGYAFMQNLDATNYVVWGPDDSSAIVTCGKLKPGEWAWVRIAPSVILRAQADTAAVKLFVQVFED